MRKRFNRRRKQKRTLGLRLIIIGIILIFVVYLIDMRIRPIITAITTYNSQIVATRIINQAVYDELSSGDYKYDNLVSLTSNSSGDIIAIESNMLSINTLKTRITDRMNETMSDIAMSDVPVSVGTLTGLRFFYNRGPKISIKIMPRGHVKTQLVSSFESAGINQTLHQINLQISVNISAIIPGYTSSVDVVTNYTVAETVIVGTVPEGYTQVMTGDDNIIRDINDYMP